LGEGIAEGAETSGAFRGRIIRCADPAAAASILKENIVAGDAVLLKASRGEQLEKVLEEWNKQP
jgi:UDP-N-acetylmuramyl pentapeptide synthase